MRFSFYVILSLFFLLFSSFQVQESDLLGIWQMNVHTGCFQKLSRQPTSRSYFVFKKKGALLFIQNNKACGDNNEKAPTDGSWKQINDSTLVLKYHSCAGEVYIQWEQDKKSTDLLRYRMGYFAGDSE